VKDSTETNENIDKSDIIENITEYISLVSEYNLDELSINTENYKVQLKRNIAPPPQPTQREYASESPVQYDIPIPQQPATVPQQPSKEVKTDEIIANENQALVMSPVNGTFYVAPAPDQPPFVQEGDTVNTESVVCIVEAMKMMNEIKAECNGTIDKILVENADSVNEGQALIVIKTN
jgi:acetyl-CoA carboxylase biotin carboxyl carrier protein